MDHLLSRERNNYITGSYLFSFESCSLHILDLF